MPGYDFRKPRLYVDAPLADGRRVALERGQAHYLTTVLRLKAGQEVLVFNGRDGEWREQIMQIAGRGLGAGARSNTQRRLTLAALKHGAPLAVTAVED